jgi:two-component system NarL family sensor kinase
MYTKQLQYCTRLIFLLLLSLRLHAQEHSQVISTGEDTTRVKYLMKESAIKRISSPDSAILLLNEALRISRLLQYEEGIAGSMLSIAFCYQDKNDFKRSKTMLAMAYPHCLNISTKNKRIMPALYNGWASTYTGMGNNDSALKFFYKALAEIDKTKLKDTLLLAQVYSNMGTAWMQKSDPAKGLLYHKKAENLIVQLKDSMYLANIHCNMGVEYLALKDTIRAVHYLKSALNTFIAKQNAHGSKFTYYALGTTQREPQKAIPYYEAALAYDSLSAFAAGVYQGVGGSYYLMGDYRRAESYYKKAQVVCEQEHLLTHRLANYSALSSIYEHLGDFKSAFINQVAYANLNDSLLNVENAKASRQLELKYQTAEKDKELAQSKVLLYSLQKRVTLMAAGVILLLGLGTAFWRNNRQKQKLQSERIRNFEQQQKIEHLHSKMQGEEEERSRIARELHDGVNVLLSATKMNYAALGKEHKGLPDTKTYGEIMDLLNNMGMELRTITYKLVPELLIQQSLPDAIETFCELIQKGNNLHIELQTYGSFTALPPELCFAVYRIVQELVHNIVKHAHATQVLIALVHQDELLRLTVEDNGNGFDPEKTTKGLGLKSIKSRVKDIDGNITFSSQKDEGTSVEIEVVTSVLT